MGIQTGAKPQCSGSAAVEVSRLGRQTRVVSGSCPYAHNETAAFPMLILDLDDPDGHEVHLHVRNHVPEIGHVNPWEP